MPIVYTTADFRLLTAPLTMIELVWHQTLDEDTTVQAGAAF
jgi:hypothetical protein